MSDTCDCAYADDGEHERDCPRSFAYMRTAEDIAKTRAQITQMEESIERYDLDNRARKRETEWLARGATARAIELGLEQAGSWPVRHSIEYTVSAETYATLERYASGTSLDVNAMADFVMHAGIGSLEVMMKQDGETPAELVEVAAAIAAEEKARKAGETAR